MIWKSRKIASRNSLFQDMKYQIICGLPGFFDARTWCWEQWGPGIEAHHFYNHLVYTGKTLSWAWDCEKYQGSAINNGKIYLTNDEMLTMFRLRWAL
jgi:hypothetical protein